MRVPNLLAVRPATPKLPKFTHSTSLGPKLACQGHCYDRNFQNSPSPRAWVPNSPAVRPATPKLPKLTHSTSLGPKLACHSHSYRNRFQNSPIPRVWVPNLPATTISTYYHRFLVLLHHHVQNSLMLVALFPFVSHFRSRIPCRFSAFSVGDFPAPESVCGQRVSLMLVALFRS